MMIFLFFLFWLGLIGRCPLKMRLKELPVLTKPVSEQVNVRTPLTMVFVPPQEVREWPREG